MLTELGLQNFKLHKDTTLKLKPITIFIGPNNSGKSSIFQAIQLLKQAKLNDSTILVQNIAIDKTYLHFMNEQRMTMSAMQGQNKYLIDLGDFKDIISKPKAHLSMHFCGNKQVENETYTYKVVLIFRENRLVKHYGDLRTSDEIIIEWAWDADDDKNRDPNQQWKKDFHFDNGMKIHVRPSDKLKRIIEMGGGSKGENASEKEYQEHISKIQSKIDVVNDFIHDIHMIYGLRGSEMMYYPLADHFLDGFESLLLGDRSSVLTSSLPYHNVLEEQLSNWLQQYLGIGIKSEMAHGKRVGIRIKKEGKPTALVNEGLGIHQVIYILAPIALGKRGDTFLIEEPEAHLHPKNQAGLMKLLLKVSQKEEKQFIMATHSEHILYPLLNAIAKKELSLDDLAVYYFDNINNKAETTPLEIDERGRVKGGLPGFFEQDLEELINLLKMNE